APQSLTASPRTVSCLAPSKGGYTVSLASRENPGHGKAEYLVDQAHQLRRHGLFLRHQEEPAYDDRDARAEEVRSACAQARRLPRIQDQVGGVRKGLPSCRAGAHGPLIKGGGKLLSRHVSSPSPDGLQNRR